MLVVKLHYTETRHLQKVLEEAMQEMTADDAAKMLLIARKLEIQSLVMVNAVHDLKNETPF